MTFDADALNPAIQVGDFIWTEPVTTLTDFLVAVVCWYAFYRFYKSPVGSRRGVSYTHFKYYFLLFAIGMTSAAWLGHGFQNYISPEFKIIGWMFGATGLMFLQLGSLEHIRNQLTNRTILVLRGLFLLEWLLVLFLLILPETRSFKITQLNSVIALIMIVLPIHVMNYRKNSEKASMGLILALIYSAIPGLVYNFHIGFSRWFNFHDLSHVLVAIIMWLMFRATFRLSHGRGMT